MLPTNNASRFDTKVTLDPEEAFAHLLHLYEHETGRLRQAFDAVFADASNRASFERLGVDVTPSSAADHLAFMRAQEATWAPILRTIEPQ